MSEKQDRGDRFFDGLVRRAIVPRGFRPQNDQEIESMLDALGTGEMSDEKLQRMLGKIHGMIPMSWEADRTEATSLDLESVEARELAQMFRAKGEELPPELEQKLRELEQRAAQPPDEEENSDGQ